MKVLMSIWVLLISTLHVFGQVTNVTISGSVKEKTSDAVLPYVNLILKTPTTDSTFVAGVVTDDKGIFSIGDISPGNYLLELSFVGYTGRDVPLLVGRLSEFLDLGSIELEENTTTLAEVTVQGKQDAVAATMEKKFLALLIT
jgi:CarboxypepD_reg-like domain